MAEIGKKTYIGLAPPLGESEFPDDSGVQVSPRPLRPLTPSQRIPSVRTPGESQFPEPTGFSMVAKGVKGDLKAVFPSEAPSSVRSFSQRAALQRKKPQIEEMRGKLLRDSSFFPGMTYTEKTYYAEIIAELLCVKLIGISTYEDAAPILTQFFTSVDCGLFTDWLKGKRFNHNLCPMNDPLRKTTPWRAMSQVGNNPTQWKIFNPASRAMDTLPLFKILIGLDL